MTGPVGGDPSLDADEQRVLFALLAMQRESWEQGVTSHALLDHGCHHLARVIARDVVVRQTPAGKLGAIEDTGIVNCAANGEVVAWAARTLNEPDLQDALTRQTKWLKHAALRTKDGTLLHLEGRQEVWVDSVYMVVPYFVLVGDIEAAAGQLRGHRARLFDPSAGLYAHRWDEDMQRLARGDFWGTGNGWVVAGIARALRLLGEARNEHREFAEEAARHAREVIDACLAHRADDGAFRDVLDDPTSFPETNLAQMLAYAALTGVVDGWLPSTYEAVGRSLLAAARQRIDLDGFVRPVCGAPHFDRPGVSAEAQAFFLLASSAAKRAGGRTAP
jgi:unsaturated rhamnogalacturonyl hydrolase